MDMILSILIFPIIRKRISLTIILDSVFQSQHIAHLMFSPMCEVWKVVTADTFAGLEQTFSADLQSKIFANYLMFIVQQLQNLPSQR